MNRVFPSYFFNLSLRVLVDKFINMHESTAHTHLDLITLLNLYIHTLLTKLIDSFGLPQEKNSNILLLWISIEVIGEGHINLVMALSNVNCLVLVQRLVLLLQLLYLLDGLLLVELEVLQLLE